MMRLLPLLALACAPTETVPTPPALPLSTCQLTPYSAVPTEELGILVDWEPAPEMSVSADLIRTVAEEVGLDGTDIRYGVQAWRVRYTTQDRGQTVEATGLVGLPDTITEPLPVVLWTHHTLGFSDACGPSGLPLEGVGQVLLAAYGYAVIAPDYLGMNGWGEPSGQLHPYALAEPTALASLDALRMLRSPQSGEPPWTAAPLDSGTIVFGASEGGFAASWVHRYAPYYLPEADIRGVVALVPPTDLYAIAREGTAAFIDATMGLAAVMATASDWYDLPLSEVLSDEPPQMYASTLPAALLEDCGGFDIGDPQSVADVFQPDFIAGDRTERVECILRENSLSRTTIPSLSDVPMLIVGGERDELVVGSTVRDSIEPMCAAGLTLEFHECAGQDHIDAGASALPYALRWASRRLAREPLESSCDLNPPVDCASLP